MANYIINIGAEAAIVACGGPQKLADRMGVTKAAVSLWRRQGIPLARVPEIERITAIPRTVLRPDYWPAADAPARVLQDSENA